MFFNSRFARWREKYNYGTFRRRYFYCAAPFSGAQVDVINFSYSCITNGVQIVIPECQHMIVMGDVFVDCASDSELFIDCANAGEAMIMTDVTNIAPTERN